MPPNPPLQGEGDRQPQAGGGGGPELLNQPIKQVRQARKLRKSMSLPEVLLWREPRKRPCGYKFRKQFPLAPYCLDFACLSARLANEIDGEAHERGDAPRRDLQRDRFLVQRGFRVMRVPGRDVLNDLESCVDAIVVACRESGPPPPSARSDGPPPRTGEDL